MKSKSGVPGRDTRLDSPKVEPSKQPITEVNEELVKVNQFINDLPKSIEELEQVQNKLEAVLSGAVLIAEMLIAHGDDKLELENESGEKILYSKVAEASGEILDLYVAKLYAACNQLSGIRMELNYKREALVPKKGDAAIQSAA